MSNQSKAKSSKRTRKKRSIVALANQAVSKVNHINYHFKHGHCPSKRYGGDLVDNSFTECERRQYSFEDEYKTYRRTRGRRGLAPNADVREDENPQIRLFKTLATHCGRFPIGELMEHPISNVAHYNLKTKLGKRAG